MVLNRNFRVLFRAEGRGFALENRVTGQALVFDADGTASEIGNFLS